MGADSCLRRSTCRAGAGGCVTCRRSAPVSEGPAHIVIGPIRRFSARCPCCLALVVLQRTLYIDGTILIGRRYTSHRTDYQH